MTAPLDLDALGKMAENAWYSTEYGETFRIAARAHMPQIIARVRDLTQGNQALLIAVDALKAECDSKAALLAEAERALEHIAQRESRMSCCKFAALSGHRRRHLKETAREALAGIRAAKGAAG